MDNIYKLTNKFIVLTLIIGALVAGTVVVHAADACSIVANGTALIDNTDYWFDAPAGRLDAGATIIVTLTDSQPDNNAPGGNSNMYWLGISDANTGETLTGFSGLISPSGTVQHAFTAQSTVDTSVVGFTDERVNYAITICNGAQREADAVSLLPTSVYSDGRINKSSVPIAIYPHIYESDLADIHIYAVDPVTGQGHIALAITRAEIEAVGVPGEANVLLAEGKNVFTGHTISLYRLTSGWFQVNTTYQDGKSYVFTWNDDDQQVYLEQ